MIMEDEKKHRSLERALNLTESDSFVYYYLVNGSGNWVVIGLQL
jgi:hypothetical protein